MDILPCQPTINRRDIRETCMLSSIRNAGPGLWVRGAIDSAISNCDHKFSYKPYSCAIKPESFSFGALWRGWVSMESTPVQCLGDWAFLGVSCEGNMHGLYCGATRQTDCAGRGSVLPFYTNADSANLRGSRASPGASPSMAN